MAMGRVVAHSTRQLPTGPLAGGTLNETRSRAMLQRTSSEMQLAT